MSREDVAVYCVDHLPRRNVVVYETVGETFHPEAWRAPDWLFYRDPPGGWRMGVRYRRRPPRDYGLQAAEPNVASDYLAEYRTRSGGRYFFTRHSPQRHRTERAAICATLSTIGERRERLAMDMPSLTGMWEDEERLWQAMEAQCELRSRIRDIAFSLPLVSQLHDSGALVALALIGSLNNRDFIPGLSDIDLWVLGRRLKPGLKIEYVEKVGHDIEVNLVCRNLKFLRRSLREGLSVDLVALRYGEALYDDGFLRSLRRRADRYRVTKNTRDMWMKSSARWLSRALQQYFSPDCAHCFFGALYHAARDLLRANVIAHGGDLLEGWEVEADVMQRWPDLSEAFGCIRWARAHWEGYAFPLFEDRTRIEGELGELVLALEAIARPVYRDYGLRLPAFGTFFDGFVERQGATRFFCTDIQPEEGAIHVGYEQRTGKLKVARRKIPRVQPRDSVQAAVT